MTCRVARRRKAFEEAGNVQCVRAEIVRTCAEKQFEETASVYMPDHLHMLVIGLTADSAFIAFMTVLRQRTAVAYRKRTGEALWQDGYYERILRPGEEAVHCIEYMRDNPVRARLVTNAEEYPFFFRQCTV